MISWNSVVVWFFFFNAYFFCVSVTVQRWKRVPGLGTTRHLTEAGVRYADDWRRLKTIQIWSENATGTPPLFLTHEAPMTINYSSYCTCLYVWVCWNIHIEYTIGSWVGSALVSWRAHTCLRACISKCVRTRTHIKAVTPISQREGGCLALSPAIVPYRLANLCAKPLTSVLLMMGSGGRFGG